ncbi:MAG: DUF3769 domain-containing protein [Cyanobacteria bacterium P01_E01_bin.6]
MPYPVFPPPPSPVVEVQPYSVDNTNHVNPPSDDSTSALGNESTVDQQVGDRSQTSESRRLSEVPNWPSLLASPDIFLTEFSNPSITPHPGTQLAEYERGIAEASLLGNDLSVRNEMYASPSPWQQNPSGQPLHYQSAGVQSSFHEIDDLSIQTSSAMAVSPGTDGSAIFATKSSTQLQEALRSIAHAPLSTRSNNSLPTASEQDIDTSENVVLGQETFNETPGLNDDAAHQTTQMSNDMKVFDARLVEPLEDVLSELYLFAQQAEQDSLELLDDIPSGTTPLPQPSGGEILVIPVDGVPTQSVPADSLDDIPILGEPIPTDVNLNELPETELPEGELIEETDLTLPESLPQTESGVPAEPIPLPAAGQGDVIELTSDRQIYDTQRRVFIAEGNVEMRVRGSILNADRVQVNLPNKIAVAEGDVFFTRGEQVLRGDRIEYNLVLEEGSVIDARGELFLPGVSTDIQANQTDASSRSDAPPLIDQLARDQPPVQAASAVGGVIFGGSVGSQRGPQSGAGGGEVRQVRFEADTIDFYPGGWEATNVRITNDPFSPPELELRTSQATFRQLSPTRSELVARRPRLVFDQGLSVPLFRRRFVFDENRSNAAALAQFGFDQDDRGGLFIEREFEVLANPIARFSVRPQFFIQRAFDREDDDDGGDFSLADAFGVIANLDITIDGRTSIDSRLELTSFDLADFEDEGRASVRVNRSVLPINLSNRNQPQFHNLTAEYSFRDRLFNGTLGFQTVQETFGLVLTSPQIRLTRDDRFRQGLDLTYQAAIQSVNANVAADSRQDLLGDPPFDSIRATLVRYQLAAQLRQNFIVWQGIPLPATPEEGVKYTPNPVVPFISIIPRIQGIASFYSNGDTQPILTGEVTLRGQFGHFSRPYFDYLGFSLTYRRSTEGSESPFNFDRLNDREVISGSLTAQIYGPFRAGVRTSISLDEDEEFDNSFFLEYSRRTYGIILSFNPDREIGSLGLRISDFNWTGVPERFDGEETDNATGSGVDSTNIDLNDAEDSSTESIPVDDPPADDSDTTANPATDPIEGDVPEIGSPDAESLESESSDAESEDSGLIDVQPIETPSIETNSMLRDSVIPRQQSSIPAWSGYPESDTQTLFDDQTRRAEPVGVPPFETTPIDTTSEESVSIIPRRPSPIPTWPGIFAPESPSTLDDSTQLSEFGPF